MSSVVDRVLDLCDRADPRGVRGLYLYGSSIVGGLRRDSDLDLLLITGASLEPDERRRLTDLPVDYSDARAGGAGGRPVELTSVVHSSLVPWSYPPACDYQYGEWLLDELIPLVPAADVRRAIHDSLAALLADLIGDERNVLLTLARMIVTLESDDIVPKDAAAHRVAEQLAPAEAAVLDLAGQAYLGEAADDWTMLGEQARATADQLATSVETIYRRTLTL